MDILENNNNFSLNADINGPVFSASVGLLMVTAFFSNLFVIIVTLCHPKTWKQTSTIFLTSLLLADLVAVVFVMPFTVGATARSRWIFGESLEEKNVICQLVGYMFWYSILLVAMTLAAVSVDRFVFIVRPLVHKKYFKPRIACIAVVVVWVTCAGLSSTPFYGLGEFEYSKSVGTCDMNVEYRFVILFSIIIALIVGTIAVTSIWTYCFTKRFLDQHQGDDNLYNVKKRRILGMFGSLTLACLICYGFGIAMAVVANFPGLILPDGVYATAYFLVYFLTLANPLIQSCFRPDVKAVFAKCCVLRLRKGGQSVSQLTGHRQRSTSSFV